MDKGTTDSCYGESIAAALKKDYRWLEVGLLLQKIWWFRYRALFVKEVRSTKANPNHHFKEENMKKPDNNYLFRL